MAPRAQTKPLPPGVYHARSKKGGYYIMYDGPRNIDGSRNQKTESGFRSISEASRTRALRMGEVEQGTFVEPTKITVREYLTSWLAVKRKEIGKGTYRNYRVSVGAFSKAIGAILLKDLKAYHIKDYLLKQLENGKYSLSYARIRLTHIRSALKDAVADQILTANPAKTVKLPRSKGKKKKPIMVFSPEQVKQAINISDFGNRKYHNFTIAAFHTGARRAELLGLRIDNVDFENKTVTFAQQVNPGEKGQPPSIEGILKTDASYRTISVDDFTLEALKREIVKRAKEKLIAGKSYNDNGLIFAKSDGSPWIPDTVSSWYTRLGKKMKCSGFTLHATRHTHASILLTVLKQDAVTVSKRLGHSTVTMTLNIYGHLLKGGDREAVVQFGEMIQNAAVIETAL